MVVCDEFIEFLHVGLFRTGKGVVGEILKNFGYKNQLPLCGGQRRLYYLLSVLKSIKGACTTYLLITRTSVELSSQDTQTVKREILPSLCTKYKEWIEI